MSGGDERSSLFSRSVNDQEKSFVTFMASHGISTGVNDTKLFSSSLMLPAKLVCVCVRERDR